jgi:hypothetical protein
MNRALIVIDVQESFRQRPAWQAVSNPDIVAQTNRLVEFARAQGDLVVWVMHSEPGSDTVFDPAGGHVRLMDGLVPGADEPVIIKSSHNAFTTTNLQQRGHVRSRRDRDVPDPAPGRTGGPLDRRDPRRPRDAVHRRHHHQNRVRTGRPVRDHPHRGRADRCGRDHRRLTGS